MKGKMFIYTNIFIYLFSYREKAKQRFVIDFLEENRNNIYVWSPQIASELFNVLIRKFRYDPIEVKDFFNSLKKYEEIVEDTALIKNAIDIHVINKLSFLDSKVVASAIKGNCKYLITDNLTHLQEIQGVQIVNPFKL